MLAFPATRSAPAAAPHADTCCTATPPRDPCSSTRSWCPPSAYCTVGSACSGICAAAGCGRRRRSRDAPRGSRASLLDDRRERHDVVPAHRELLQPRRPTPAPTPARSDAPSRAPRRAATCRTGRCTCRERDSPRASASAHRARAGARCRAPRRPPSPRGAPSAVASAGTICAELHPSGIVTRRSSPSPSRSACDELRSTTSPRCERVGAGLDPAIVARGLRVEAEEPRRTTRARRGAASPPPCAGSRRAGSSPSRACPPCRCRTRTRRARGTPPTQRAPRAARALAARCAAHAGAGWSRRAQSTSPFRPRVVPPISRTARSAAAVV